MTDEKKKVVLFDSKTRQPIASFDTMEEAIAYAEDNDLQAYIKLKDHLQ